MESLARDLLGPTYQRDKLRQSEERIKQKGDIANQRNQVSMARLSQQGEFQRARLQNQQMIGQMRLMMLQKQLAGMQQARALQMLQLKQSQDNANEKIREFNALEQDKRDGIGGSSGRGLGSAPIQAENNFMNNVSLDNPQLGNDDKKVREAANAYLNGKRNLADGTPLNEPSDLTKGSMGTWAKYQTTAPAINSMIKAKQAESEVGVLAKKISEYNAPYGTTYLGKSPKEMIDSFKSDDESQDRLGKLIASQLLTYDMSQMQIRMQQGESSQAITQDLMGKSGQNIDVFSPKLSGKARDAAMKYINQAFQEVLNAREAIGINASIATNPQSVGSAAAAIMEDTTAAPAAPEVKKILLTKVNGEFK